MSSRNKKLPKPRFHSVCKPRGRPSHEKLYKTMTREHVGILQNIEFTLAHAHREDGTIDDCVVLNALRAALRGERPSEPRAQRLFDALAAMREMRSDVEDGIWTSGLRVVADSVELHSNLQPGATGYLDFVGPFLP